MFAPLVLLGALLAYVTADIPPFQASPSIAANTTFILSAANQTISHHSTNDSNSGPYPLGLGDNRTAEIFTTWPVFLSCVPSDFRTPFSLKRIWTLIATE
jgi:hypothetical protein